MASAASCTKTKGKDRKVGALCAGAAGYPGVHLAEFTFTYANTYATGGGDPCDLTSTFPNEVIFAFLPPIDNTGTVIPRFDKTNKKMLAYKAGSGSAAPAEYGAVDLSAATFKFCAIGY